MQYRPMQWLFFKEERGVEKEEVEGEGSVGAERVCFPEEEVGGDGGRKWEERYVIEREVMDDGRRKEEGWEGGKR